MHLSRLAGRGGQLAWSRGVAFILAAVSGTSAYIPAQPTNDTSQLSHSSDFIQLNWRIQSTSNVGNLRNDVSRQLVADNSTQVGTQYAARGALVHFTETNASLPATNTPWVAFISCDKNESDVSMIDDIFTLTRDHGAVAALLYTVHSEACLINEEYINDFEKPIDVYATTDKQAARLMASPFMTADDNVYWYDSQALNDSETSIWSQLNATIFLDPDVKPTSSEDEDSSTLQDDDDSELSSGSTFTKTLLESTSQDELGSLMISSADYVPPDMSEGSSQAASPTPAPVSEWQLIRRDAPSSGAIEDISDAPSNYLIAVVANKDAKFASNSDPSSTSNDDDDDKKNHGKSLTGLAMIILYAITGAVTLLFVAVIVNGAIKAIRHPERYGPRARQYPGGPGGQGRARGISRAILDSFPVVRFGRSPNADPEQQQQQAKARTGDQVEMDISTQIQSNKEPSSAQPSAVPLYQSQNDAADTQEDRSATEGAPVASNEEPPQSCPICVCDFESDEEVRVLPCQAHHIFHKECIDPWLLDISSLCPLCRWDVTQDADEAGTVDEFEHHEQEAPGQSGRFFSISARARQAARRASNLGSHRRESTSGTAESGFSRSRFRSYLQTVQQGPRARRRQRATQAAQDLTQNRQMGHADNSGT